MAFLEVKDLVKINNGISAVEHLSFNQERLQKLAISGETGSGKTSVLKMIGGLLQPEGGQILFEGKRVMGPHEQLIAGHPSIAYLSQYFELRNNYFVHELLDMANRMTQPEADLIYEVCQVEYLLGRKTDQLSGGEKQRVSLARLLTRAPRLLLLDEPYSNSDLLHKAVMQEVVRNVSEQLKITCLMVSHDAADVLAWADEIIVLKNGSFYQQGSAAEVYYRPKDEYVAGLFGAFNAVPMEGVTGKKLFLRPEQMKISREETPGSIKAVVRTVYFRGGTYLLAVSSGDETYYVQVLNNDFHPAQELWLSYEQNGWQF